MTKIDNEENIESEKQENIEEEEIIKEDKSEDLKKIIEDLNNKLLRSFADIENLRKRNKEELEKANKYAISNFANDLVVIVEQFFLASDNAPNEEINKNLKIKNFADAIFMTKNELMKLLERNNIKRIYPLNEKFDHNFHEALSKIEGKEDNIIQKVIQAGYSIGNRLIKPALVIISVKK